MKIVKPSYEIITKDTEKEILQKLEYIGRTCYKSEGKITDDSCYGFVKGLIKRGHEAMIEHAILTVKFTCDRGVTHEIVRHRLASYAQESTRYCNYSKDKFNNEISFIDIRNGIDLDLAMCKARELSEEEGGLTDKKIEMIINEWEDACADAEKHYLKMISIGATPNIARSVLPNSTKTELNVTMNLREWRAFFKLRADNSAHPQMRELTKTLLHDFATRYPTIFLDLDEKYNK